MAHPFKVVKEKQGLLALLPQGGKANYSLRAIHPLRACVYVCKRETHTIKSLINRIFRLSHHCLLCLLSFGSRNYMSLLLVYLL